MFLCGTILIMMPLSVFAQTHNNIVSARWGISSEMMMNFKVDYHYKFNRFIGIGGGIFLNSEFGQVKMPHGNISSSGGSISWISENKVTKPGFSISALGEIDIFKIKGRSVMLEVEPSWILSIPRESQILHCQNVISGETFSEKVNASGGQWGAWLLRMGLSFLVIDHCALGISYNITNFDSFSTARLLEYQGRIFDKFYQEKKSIVHSVDIGLRIIF